jgi:hypothetical protein
MILHTFQAIKTRALWNLVFAVGCLSMFDLSQYSLLIDIKHFAVIIR